jgi:hypothetical protein
VKIRSQSELTDFLDQSLAWRKQEITNLRFSILKATREHEKRLLARAGVPLLYAHWEGFAKSACEAYLGFVSRQGLRYDQLKTNFVAIASKGAIREAGQSNRIQLYLNVIEFATFNQGNIGKFTLAGSIDSEDNLSSKVLLNLLTTVGIYCDDFFTSRFLVLDGSLLKKRNEIAHGEKTEVDTVDYDQLHTLVLELIDYLKRRIETAAANSEYRRP